MQGVRIMESRNLMGAVVIAVVALVAGSFIVYGNSDGPGDDVQATEMENKDVKASASGEVTVPMKGNLTTGYDWVVVSLPDGLTLVKDWYEADNTGGLVGAGGVHYFTFSGEKAGTYEVVFDYQRSWLGSEGNTETVQITIQ